MGFRIEQKRIFEISLCVEDSAETKIKLMPRYTFYIFWRAVVYRTVPAWHWPGLYILRLGTIIILLMVTLSLADRTAETVTPTL